MTYYVRAGKSERARKLLARVPSELEADKLLKGFVLAQVYALLGDREQAAAHYRQTLAAAPDNPGLHVRYAAFLSRLMDTGLTAMLTLQ